jgi:outer membrane biogenesis lipoprotein LolB
MRVGVELRRLRTMSRQRLIMLLAATAALALAACSAGRPLGPLMSRDDGPSPITWAQRRQELRDARGYLRWLRERTTTYGAGTARRRR